MTPTPHHADTEADVDALKGTAADVPAAAADEADAVRVCHVSMTLKTGGLERLLVELGRHRRSRRLHLQFVALSQLGAPARELRQMGFKVESLDFPNCGKRGLLQRLRGLFEREQIDVVHTHNTYPYFYAALAARRAGTPVVINTQHGRGCGPGWKDRLLFRIANRLGDRIVGVSEDATHLCRKQDPWSSRKLLRIWNGIDVHRFSFAGPADALTAITVSRLSREKDLGTLLRAAAIARKDFPELRLRVVGDGPERPGLERLAAELHIAPHVEFLGERADVPQLLAGAGFFAASSRSEGVSLTLLEAMAVGLPIVTTTVGGNPEVVLEGRTGMLAPPENPEALAAALVRMCRARKEWLAMGQLARDRVEAHFHIQTMVQRYEDLYLECLEQKRRRR